MGGGYNGVGLGGLDGVLFSLETFCRDGFVASLI